MPRSLKKIPLEYFFLALILFLALGLRFYKIDIPLADHHSWRQADTAAVARNFIKEGFNFLQPKIDNMTPLARPDLPNNKRLFLVEPPIYQTFVAVVYRLAGVQEKFARLVSTTFYLGAIIFLYLLTKRFLSRRAGLLAAFFMATLPYGIFYSRVILPEPMMLFASLGMVYWFDRWLESAKIKEGVLAWFFTAWALSIKTFPLFLILPMAYLVWEKYRFQFFRQRKIWIFAFLAVLPLVFWRLWISQFPEGIPPSDWLFNQGGIRFRPAFFRWIFGERISKLILGYWGLPLFLWGLILKPTTKRGWLFHWWLVSFLLYVTVLAAGNVAHDYYQIPFIPLAAVFLARGADWLLTASGKVFHKKLGWLLLVICFLFMFSFSWYEVRGFYLIQGGVDLAGRAVDELTPPNALVLTGDSNDATLLYNTNRYGWTGGYASFFPNSPETIERVRAMGATIYVSTKFEKDSDFGRYLWTNYPLMKLTDQYVIFSLVKSP